MIWDNDTVKRLSQYALSYLGGVKEDSCRFQGGNWKYLEAGKGDVILCLHGISGSKVAWRSFMHGMAANYQVLSPDVPGLSLRVGFVDSEPTKRKMLDWMHGFLKAKEIGKVHLVCHATGGIMGAYYAQSFPDDVASFTWVNPPDLDKVRAGSLPMWERVKLGFSDIQQVEEYSDSFFYNPPKFPNVVKRFFLKSVMDTISDGTLVRFIESEIEALPLLMSKLRGLKVPTLLVAGDHDVMSSQSWVLKLNRLISGSELVTLERCGQICMIERVEELVVEYHRYLDELKKA
ncbi:hypothetical protein A9Q99_21990 [Gammaproteobacteria bacterium 45_16_T64]|nr:hypothetical protein A9Q99_21990 [Gammaproteobacteria bacterium 45_16_T64]